MSNVKLYIIRHGQTDYNLAGKIQGDGADISLNQQGIAEAQAAAKYLFDSKIFFSRVTCSPLRRTLETLDQIALVQNDPHFFKNQVIIDSRVRERSFGILHHKTKLELDQEIQKWQGPTHLYKPLNGESREDLYQRVREWFLEENDRASKVTNQNNYLLVTHGGVVRSLLSIVNGLNSESAQSFDSDNAAINIIELGSQPLLIEKNFTKHLADAGLLEKQVRVKIA